MKRLTTKGFEITPEYVVSGLTIAKITEMLQKLQQYEDAGYEPEEIRLEMKQKNERKNL